jgi:hypothetical protein
MFFELVPVIDLMLEFYQAPRNFDRFQAYLKILQGNTKADLSMAISGYNPMAATHISEKLQELKAINAEQIVAELVKDFNENITAEKPKQPIKIVLNIADDLKGGWTNRFTTDYDSKFKLSGLVSRGFCTPFFWTSEMYTRDLVIQRTRAAMYRTIYWLRLPKPKTLKEHLEQEIFVADHVGYKGDFDKAEIEILEQFYNRYRDTEQYSLIFNFFYGDEASRLLAFPAFGVTGKNTGFQYSIFLAAKKAGNKIL